MTDDHVGLLQAIGEALGHPGPYLEIKGELEAAISLGMMSSAPISDHREVLRIGSRSTTTSSSMATACSISTASTSAGA